MAEVTEGLVVIDEGKDTESTDAVSCCWTTLVWFTGF